MKQAFLLLFLSFFVVACSSQPRIVVNQATVKDQEQYVKDFDLCYDIAKTIDLTDETALKSIAGAAVGGTAVAGVATAVAGAVFAPAIPFIVAGSLAGGGLWGASSSKEEQIARERVMTQCLRGKGYEVYSARG